MDNLKKNTGFPACVLCSNNFTDNDADTIVTTCGHQYHKHCLLKWFVSLEDLDPNGQLKCPTCRDILNQIEDIKPVYPFYSIPEDIKSELKTRDNEEKANLRRLLHESASEQKETKRQLSMEIAKSKRLTSKIDSLEKKLKATTTELSRDTTTLSHKRNMMAANKKAKTTTLRNAPICTEKGFKKLRTRVCTYSL